MDFDTFIAQGWQDHPLDSAAVAQRLQLQVPPLVAQEADIGALSHLAQHVMGEHLGLWSAAVDFQCSLRELPPFDPAGPSGQAVRRAIAGLQLSAGEATALDGLQASDRVRAAALAASALVSRDTARASALLQQAVAEAEAAHLSAADPCHRSLAASGHNLACELEENAHRTPEQTRLMVLAALTSRRYWALAGTWLETERAEYRLAMSWLQAGDVAQARQHAQACLDIVQMNAGDALERFYAHEALGLVAGAAADGPALAEAQALAQAVFAELSAADQDSCQTSLDKLLAR